ncbi:MAG: hypothetical protein AB7S44_04080 [Spirochaetales bacterium]
MEDRKLESNSAQYVQYYDKGWDVFSMLGESVKQSEFAGQGGNLRKRITQFLVNKNITPDTAQDFLTKRNSRIRSFDELVEMTFRAYKDQDQVTDRIVKDLIYDIKREENKVVSKAMYTPKDLIALVQYARIQEHKEVADSLISGKDINKNNISHNAVPYYKLVNGVEVPYYDYASVKNKKYRGLEFPFSKFYVTDNKTYLSASEQTFDKYEMFKHNLKSQWGYTVKTGYKAPTNDYPVRKEGRRIFVDEDSLSNTEAAVGAMYEVTKAQSKMRFGRVQRLFENRTLKTEKADFNPRKAFKYEKEQFKKHKALIEDVIAILSTINMARMYMTGETFHKIEDYLTLQASRKLAGITSLKSPWVLPYISKRVLAISEMNYFKNGIDTLAEYKELYSRGYQKIRNLDELTSLADIMFAEKDYENTAQRIFSPQEDNAKTKSQDAEKGPENGPKTPDGSKGAEVSEQDASYMNTDLFKAKVAADQARINEEKLTPRKADTLGKDLGGPAFGAAAGNTGTPNSKEGEQQSDTPVAQEGPKEPAVVAPVEDHKEEIGGEGNADNPQPKADSPVEDQPVVEEDHKEPVIEEDHKEPVAKEDNNKDEVKDEVKTPVIEIKDAQLYLTEEENTFKQYETFKNQITSVWGYDLDLESADKNPKTAVSRLGNTIIINENVSTNTENAIKAMQEIVREQVKSGKIVGSSLTEEQIPVYKSHKGAIQEVITLLATANMAKIYMDGELLNKVQDYLITQANNEIAREGLNEEWLIAYMGKEMSAVSSLNFIQNSAKAKETVTEVVPPLKDPREFLKEKDEALRITEEQKNKSAVPPLLDPRTSFRANPQPRVIDHEFLGARRFAHPLHEGQGYAIPQSKPVVPQKVVAVDAIKEEPVDESKITVVNKKVTQRGIVEEKVQIDKNRLEDAKQSLQAYLRHNITDNVADTTKYRVLSANYLTIKSAERQNVEYRALADAITKDIVKDIDENTQKYVKADKSDVLVSPYHIINRYLENKKKNTPNKDKAEIFGKVIKDNIDLLKVRAEHKEP